MGQKAKIKTIKDELLYIRDFLSYSMTKRSAAREDSVTDQKAMMGALFDAETERDAFRIERDAFKSERDTLQRENDELKAALKAQARSSPMRARMADGWQSRTSRRQNTSTHDQPPVASSFKKGKTVGNRKQKHETRGQSTANMRLYTPITTPHTNPFSRKNKTQMSAQYRPRSSSTSVGKNMKFKNEW